jgi:hypothetical protein
MPRLASRGIFILDSTGDRKVGDGRDLRWARASLKLSSDDG